MKYYVSLNSDGLINGYMTDVSKNGPGSKWKPINDQLSSWLNEYGKPYLKLVNGEAVPI